ncbi:MAG: four helix bundle protein [Candidatus Paceibacterota bacterium]
MKSTTFHERSKFLIDKYVHKVYDVTARFPANEKFGVTSQYRRADLSIVLNYIEGYARRRKAVLKNFLEISLGSFKEAEYLTQFSFKRRYLKKKDRDELATLESEIGKMLWSTINKL